MIHCNIYNCSTERLVVPMSDACRVDCCHACVDWDALTKETLNLKSHLIPVR